MKNIGVICEYNPFHNGHAKQLSAIKQKGNAVCLMSGNYVQRGEPAVLDKMVRAKAAVMCGADLVLELAVTYALRSAEGFASGGVEVLSKLGVIDGLCFGSESGTLDDIMSTAKLLLTEKFAQKLRSELASGVSFPSARQNAIEALGGNGELLENPNDILAVEYCKAIVRQNSPLQPMPLQRQGSYHESMDRENPSASMLRKMDDWSGFVPQEAMEVYASAPIYSVSAGERAWLARLRAMQEAEFERLPFGSEGLWRKLMHACREENTLEEIIAAAKSKRYTRSRLMRMLLCAYLGISDKMLQGNAPYIRVLAMNETGREILHDARRCSELPLIHAGEAAPEPVYGELERRASDLYGLFCSGEIRPPASQTKDRMIRLMHP